MIIPNCQACKHRDVDPDDEPCKTCLRKDKGIVASMFDERDGEE